MEMEFCQTKDLSRCLWQNKHNSYSERTIKQISSQLLLGLQSLHKNGIIHCNLKPSNILIDEYGNVKICDFKKSLKISTMTKTDIMNNKRAMTPCYTSPELFQNDGIYSFKSDLWALGCIMYELAVGQVPFFDESISKLIRKILNDELDFNRKELVRYSEKFVDILKKLLIKDPNQRINWGELEKLDWWEKGTFENKETQTNVTQKEKTNYTQKGIDALKLSKIAMQNLNDKKQDYNNIKKKKEIDNADQEFDFQDKEGPDEGKEINKQIVKKININNAKIPLSLSVLKISKVYKRDKRTYDNNDLLYESVEEELPKIENFVIHQTDKIIKPIIGNSDIEDSKPVTFNKNKLPFTPWKRDTLKEMLDNPKEVKNVENYLFDIYSFFDANATKKDYNSLLNLLKYFETLVYDRDLANNLINTTFLQLFISFLENIKNDQIQTSCCCIIGYLVRYATIIEYPLDKYNFHQIISNVIVNSNNNSDLMKKASATLGEYLFYVGTQEETPDSQEWHINKEYLDLLLFCLDSTRNEIVKFYTIKTIENITILTNVSKNYFASNNNFCFKILETYLNSSNNELKLSAISTISHLIRRNPTLINLFLNKCNILKNINLFLKEPENIQQCLINCLLYSLVGKEFKEIIPNCDLFIEAILKRFDKVNNVIKLKFILLLGFFMVEPALINKYGEKVFQKMMKYRKEKNIEIHISVKFFEKNFNQNNIFFSKKFINLLNKNNKPDDIITYCKMFNIMGVYHIISTSLFTKDLLNSIINYLKIKGKILKGNELIIQNLYDVLLRFSENQKSVENNINLILNNIFLDLLKFSENKKNESFLSSLTVCANLLSIILENEKIYKPGTNSELTNKIKNLIKNTLNFINDQFKNNTNIEECLSLLALILEKDENLLNMFIQEGIIDFIYKIMNDQKYLNNLNILKILICLMESENISFIDIIKNNIIDKINFLIDNLKKSENQIYNDFVIELFYSMMLKLSDYKKKKFTNNIDIELYKKNFINKIEKVSNNFELCIKLLGENNNVNVQEMSCVILALLLQFFPNNETLNLKKKLEFKNEDIPNLLKGLSLSCKKVHKTTIKIFKWIIEYQNNSNKILKPYISYLTSYLENIINTTTEADVINAAKNFLNKEIVKIK